MTTALDQARALLVKLREREAEAIRAREQAEELIAILERGLTVAVPRAKVDPDVTPAEISLARSRGITARGGAPKNAFVAHAQAAGFSQAAIARECGISPQFLSACVRREKTLPEAHRAKIEQLTGWPASRW